MCCVVHLNYFLPYVSNDRSYYLANTKYFYCIQTTRAVNKMKIMKFGTYSFDQCPNYMFQCIVFFYKHFCVHNSVFYLKVIVSSLLTKRKHSIFLIYPSIVVAPKYKNICRVNNICPLPFDLIRPQ